MAKKILVIDDEKDIVQILRKKIQSAGYEAYVAYNGQEGLELTKQVHPDLILTDIVMPIMDGFVFYNELKNSADIQHIPVIVSSAHGTTENRMRELGAKDFLLKPFNTQSLLDKIGHFFKENRAFRVLIITKMILLMKTILDDTEEISQRLDIRLSNNFETIVQEALQFKPDLIVMDVDMFIKPTADEIVEMLRAQDSLKETRILVNRSMMGDEPAMSHVANPMVSQCLSNGASHFVGSLNRQSFLSIVAEYCR